MTVSAEMKRKGERERETRGESLFLTVFVTGDGDVVDGPQLEAGAGQDLELQRT